MTDKHEERDSRKGAKLDTSNKEASPEGSSKNMTYKYEDENLPVITHVENSSSTDSIAANGNDNGFSLTALIEKVGSWFPTPHKVLEYGLPSDLVAVVVNVFYRGGHIDYTWESIKSIAKRARLGITTVKKCLATLVDLKILLKKERKGKTNFYKLNLEVSEWKFYFAPPKIKKEPKTKSNPVAARPTCEDTEEIKQYPVITEPSRQMTGSGFRKKEVDELVLRFLGKDRNSGKTEPSYMATGLGIGGKGWNGIIKSDTRETNSSSIKSGIEDNSINTDIDFTHGSIFWAEVEDEDSGRQITDALQNSARTEPSREATTNKNKNEECSCSCCLKRKEETKTKQQTLNSNLDRSHEAAGSPWVYIGGGEGREYNLRFTDQDKGLRIERIHEKEGKSRRWVVGRVLDLGLDAWDKLMKEQPTGTTEESSQLLDMPSQVKEVKGLSSASAVANELKVEVKEEAVIPPSRPRPSKKKSQDLPQNETLIPIAEVELGNIPLGIQKQLEGLRVVITREVFQVCITNSESYVNGVCDYMRSQTNIKYPNAYFASVVRGNWHLVWAEKKPKQQPQAQTTVTVDEDADANEREEIEKAQREDIERLWNELRELGVKNNENVRHYVKDYFKNAWDATLLLQEHERCGKKYEDITSRWVEAVQRQEKPLGTNAKAAALEYVERSKSKLMQKKFIGDGQRFDDFRSFLGGLDREDNPGIDFIRWMLKSSSTIESVAKNVVDRFSYYWNFTWDDVMEF